MTTLRRRFTLKWFVFLSPILALLFAILFHPKVVTGTFCQVRIEDAPSAPNLVLYLRFSPGVQILMNGKTVQTCDSIPFVWCTGNGLGLPIAVNRLHHCQLKPHENLQVRPGERLLLYKARPNSDETDLWFEVKPYNSYFDAPPKLHGGSGTHSTISKTTLLAFLAIPVLVSASRPERSVFRKRHSH